MQIIRIYDFFLPFLVRRFYPSSLTVRSPGLNLSLSLSLILTAMIGLSACQSSSSFNETAFPYTINKERIATKNVSKLIIADINFSAPSKKYLNAYSTKIDLNVSDQLSSAGFKMSDNRLFQQYWREAVRKFGNPFNPQTSQVNTAAFHRVMATVLNQLDTHTDIDAIVFTDLIERQITFGNNLNRSAKWDGVTRKPRLKGAATTLSQGFDWAQTVPAVSLRVTIYHVDGNHLFQSVGGLEVSRQIDTRKGNGRFVRRDKLFTSQSNVKQGIRFALHPFVLWKKYPEKK